MWWKNSFNGKENRKTAVFHSFGEEGKDAKNLRPYAYENCDCRGGKLRGGIGLKKVQDSSGNDVTVKINGGAAMHTFLVTLNQDGVTDSSAIYVVNMDGYLCLRNASTGVVTQKTLVGGHAEHFALKAENKAIYNIFCGEKSAVGTLDGEAFRSIFNKTNVGGCLCGKRFLLLTPNGELHYTAALAPYETENTDPNGKGVIYLPANYGAPVGIKAYGGSAYIFFERGICKLTLSATASEHTLKEIPYQGGNICIRAQATMNAGILFLAREGVCYLRNDRVERICEHLPIGPCATDKISNVGYCEDVVMFSYYKEGADGVEVKRLALYGDGADGYFAEPYGPLGGNAFACMQGKIYRYAKDCAGVEHGKASVFTSEELYFGTDKKKNLKTLQVRGKGQVAVGVKYGDSEQTYPLTFENGVAKTKIFGRDEAFAFIFYLGSGALVESVEIGYVTEG